ncbi:uncharacterized protein LOC127703046 isoform X2 [Mytilus californianus]|uniref:uncharacterized protein LOC127703046 isoform X2 n=1 Tax=Mytilus californianus TaxID=6549 RepID=UPI002246ED91|nr:uncharacterized protein LOC127703046 isoform X2 [Mytilus californianus]
MDDTSRLKAPRKLKLTKPRPRTKDLNQNNIPVKTFSTDDFPVPRSSHDTLLQEENYDIRGDYIECQTTSSDSSDILITKNINMTYDQNRNCYLSSRRSSETSSICSNPEDMNSNTTYDISKMRAPRKVKLTKPRPLRSSKSDENGNEKELKNEVNQDEENDKDLMDKISDLMSQLKQGTLSANDCLHLRDLLAAHCPHLELINKEYIDSCFRHIEEVLKEKKQQDKLVLVSLTNLIALRQRAWQPYPKPPTTRSVDSGIDVEDQVLWDTEEAFEDDLTNEIWSQCNKTNDGEKERSPSPQSVIEAVKGLKIVGEDEEFVKAAAALLQKFLKNGKTLEEKENKKNKSKNNVMRQPIGPGTSDKLVKEVEKTLPDGMHSAKGRRAMFKVYNSAMYVADYDDHEKTKLPQSYDREELLYLALSPLSKKCPAELSYLSKVFPDVCFTQVDTYFHKDSLPVKDYSWSCPIRGLSKHDTSSVDNGKHGFNSNFLRRGFSCPSGDSDTDSNSSREEIGDSQKNTTGYGTPSLMRAFSCPEGDSNSFTINGHRNGFSKKEGFGSRDISNGFNKAISSNGNRESKENISNNNRTSFGSPSDKQISQPENNKFGNQDNKHIGQRKGFGSPNNNSGMYTSGLTS